MEAERGGWRIEFDGITLIEEDFGGFDNILGVTVDIYLSRTSSTAYKYETEVKYKAGLSVVSDTISDITTGSANWTTTKIINAQADSDTVGDVICEMLQVTYYKKS